MGGKRIKKGERGEAVKYITRNKAVRKLQLNLHDFRRLCILKGIYPREPKHRRKAQKGDCDFKTLYYLKDIQFLSHEPLIWKFRDQKAHIKKVKHAEAKNDKKKKKTLMKNKPTYTIDHLVRERYPTFLHAVRDMDDPLTLLSLFAKLPRTKFINAGMVMLCRRLTVEFMHYVMEAKALRKVFISIKGYYYQAEIMGQTVTWIVPHPFRPENSRRIDFDIMKLFTEFYICMLGFINFRLYQSLNLHYPPKFTVGESEEELDGKKKETELEKIMISERIASLNIRLKKSAGNEEEEEGEKMDTHLLEESLQNVQKALEEERRVEKLKVLFQNFRFFLNRETNMESLTFVIRACSGQVSWDESVAEGYSYPESDETITHQIVDRPDVHRQYLSRYYIQPQWVYDCINARMLLPIQDYFPGVTLPPHLSPFDISTELYVPPEKEKLEAMKKGDIPVHAFPQDEESDEEESDEYNEEDEDDEEGEDKEVKKKKKVKKEKKEKIEPKEEPLDPEKQKELDKMKVKSGKRFNDHRTPWKEEQEQYKLSISMIPRKKKRVYRKLRRAENQQFYKAEYLKERRKLIDEKRSGEAADKKKRKIEEEQNIIAQKTKK